MKRFNDSPPSADAAQCGCQAGCAPKMAPTPSSQSIQDSTRVTLRIPAMDCPTEENLIRQALADIDGIRTHLDLNKPIYAKTSAYGHFGRKAGRDGSFSYYISEPIATDDFKGVGPFILACLEVERA